MGTTAVEALRQHVEAIGSYSADYLLCGESGQSRASELQFSFHSLHVDFSKQRLVPVSLELLTQWASECRFEDKLAALFAGEPVNASENKSALHMAARWPAEAVAPAGMEAAAAFCQQQYTKLAGLVEKLHRGEWRGVTGEAITDVVHIGVGGSDLGPKLVSEVLGDTLCKRFVGAHYVSTMDGS